MIYTITLNPAVDYQMEFSDPLHSKGVNLADHAYLHAGGNRTASMSKSRTDRNMC